jgi:N-acetylglucosamine malate deacetylase 2
MQIEEMKRLLVFVAHPDDETIGCSVLLQRIPSALVVFAVDGAPAGYGFERKFGSLKEYSDERFNEASRVLRLARNCSFRRLITRGGAYFPDRHLFEHLEEAAESLVEIAQGYLPNAIVSHAYEGGHIDHDACSLLARYAANAVLSQQFEFPLYWKNDNGQDVFQEFRDAQEGEISLNPSEAEIVTKNKMLAEYKTQRDIVAVFSTNRERFRPVRSCDYPQPTWNSSYPGNWRSRRDAKAALQRFSEFRKMVKRLSAEGAG